MWMFEHVWLISHSFVSHIDERLAFAEVGIEFQLFWSDSARDTIGSYLLINLKLKLNSQLEPKIAVKSDSPQIEICN